MAATSSDAAAAGPGSRPSSVTVEAERVVRAPLASVGRELVSALERLGFRVTAHHLTVIEARRGATVAGSFSPRRTPIDISVQLDPVGGCCRVRVVLAHRGSWLGGTPKESSPVVAALSGEVLSVLDAALAHLDPDAALRFSPPVWAGGAGQVTSGTIVGAIPTAADQTAAKVEATLAGGMSTQGVPDRWRRRDGVMFAAREKVAYLTLVEARAHLAIAAMVVAQPQSLPDNLRRQLELLAVRIEQALAEASVPLVRLDVADDEAKAIDFMHLQVRVRSRLALRTLQRCRDCQFEKVTNPDLAHLLQRNRRLRSLTSAFGATLWRGGVSPFVLVGTLFQLKSLDPDFVCPRCQGVSADATLVALCPGCGALTKDAVLRVCSACGHDFRAELGPDEFWVDPPEVAAATLPVSVPVPGPGGGVRCHTCGREFTALWRIVVLDPEGRLQERFVCATSPLCAPPSLTPPVSVSPVSPADLSKREDDAAPEPEASSPSGTETSFSAGPAASAAPTANWYPDPYGTHRLRYWDGSRWTEHAAD